jgi:beta-glucosidase
LSNIIEEVDAILYAWHPGTMGGPAIADLVFGREVPSGKLPVTFPRLVGQIPIYYSQKNGGKPPSADNVVHIDDIDTFFRLATACRTRRSSTTTCALAKPRFRLAEP